MNSMTDNELKIMLIEQYTNLQRIKKANIDLKNDELEYQIKSTIKCTLIDFIRFRFIFS